MIDERSWRASVKLTRLDLFFSPEPAGFLSGFDAAARGEAPGFAVDPETSLHLGLTEIGLGDGRVSHFRAPQVRLGEITFRHIRIAEIDIGQIGKTKIAFGQVTEAEIDRIAIRVPEVAFSQLDANQVALMNLGFRKIAFVKNAVRRIDLVKFCSGKTACSKNTVSDSHIGQIGTFERSSGEIATDKPRLRQVLSAEIGAFQLGTIQLKLGQRFSLGSQHVFARFDVANDDHRAAAGMNSMGRNLHLNQKPKQVQM